MRTIKSPVVLLAALCLMCLFGAVQNVSAESCEGFGFGDPNYFAGGLTPHGLGSGDLNGDSKVDLAAANEGSGTVTVRFGDGNGNFPTAIQLTTSSPSAIAMVDLNGDGHLDLAVTNRSVSRVTVWLNAGDGTFGPAVQFGTGPSPSGMTTVDLNGDGHADIITSNAGSNSVSVLLGDGSGAFGAATAFTLSGASGPWGIATADFNGDGNKDVATANRGSLSLSIRFGNGTGGFASGVNYPAGSSPISIAAGDFNADGSPDLVVANNGSNNLMVRLNNGTGTMLAPLTLAAGNQTYAVLTADLDADGNTDIVATNRGSNNVSVFLGNGDGTFAARVDHAVSAGPRSLLVADLNGDESLDIATGIDSGLIGILLNHCSSNTPPTIASGTVTRQQDSGASNSVIATVADGQDDLDDLTVMVDGGPASSQNGVTVSNIAVDAAGNVTADISASCGSSDASFTLTVTDSEGLSAETALAVDVIAETTSPEINGGAPIPDVTVYLPLNSPDLSMPVTFDLPGATDNCSAVTEITASPASGSIFNIGSTLVTVTATDELDNTATATFTVNVLFNFGGLLRPIDPYPMLNLVTAGSAIPVKFSLSGDKGLGVLAPGYPASSPVGCGDDEPSSTIEETNAAGGTGLSYDASSDTYTYVWKTDKTWRQSCRILIVKLADGRDHYARFRFR